MAAKAKEDATDSTAITAIITTATLHNMRNTTTREETTKTGDLTAYSDILEGRIFFGPRNARFFIFSDFLLTILHAMYLGSNKIASNEAKITVFLHISHNTCHPSSPKFELLKIAWAGRWDKKCQRPGKLSWGSPILPRMSGFLHLFQFSCSKKCRQSPYCLLK